MPYQPKFIRVYIQLLKTKPAQTKIVSGATIVAAGDIVAQQIIEKRGQKSSESSQLKSINQFEQLQKRLNSHDFYRTSRIFFVGLLLIAPFNYTWLDKILPRVNNFKIFKKTTNQRSNTNKNKNQRLRWWFTADKTKISLTKLLLDQAIAAPIACTLYIAGNSITKKEDPIQSVQEKLFTTVQFFWRLWLPIQFLNFRFVPQMYNMPVVQVTNFIWMSFLSYLDNQKIHVNTKIDEQERTEKF